MITFEISKWVLVAAICGIMLLGALIELLVACIYSNRDNAKKARTDENEKDLKAVGYEIKLNMLSNDLEELQQIVESRSRVYERDLDDLERLVNNMARDSAKKYDIVLQDQTVNERRIDNLIYSFDHFKTETYEREKGLADDFHDLEEHVHHWLNSKPVIKVKDKDMEVESYIRDYYAPTRTEAVLKAEDDDVYVYDYGYDECVADSWAKIHFIHEQLSKEFKQYVRKLSISDYKHKFNAPLDFIEDEYGWIGLKDSDMVEVKEVDGWHLKMPKPVKLYN